MVLQILSETNLDVDRLQKGLVILGFVALFVGPPLTMFVYVKFLGWTFQVAMVQNLQQALGVGVQTYLYSYIFVLWPLNLLWPFLAILLLYVGSRRRAKSILKNAL
jgi:hypothetical protein